MLERHQDFIIILGFCLLANPVGCGRRHLTLNGALAGNAIKAQNASENPAASPPPNVSSKDSHTSNTQIRSSLRCELSASPLRVLPGDLVTLTLTQSGPAPSFAMIDGILVAPTGGYTKVIPQTSRLYVAVVSGQAETAMCQVEVQVKSTTMPPSSSDPFPEKLPAPPTCKMSGPSSAMVGESVELSMAVMGDANGAYLNGTQVSTVGGSLHSTIVAGQTSFTGLVFGPGGFGKCELAVSVESCATLYENRYFGGTSYPIPIGDTPNVNFSRDTTSIQVFPGCHLQVFRKPNYAGKSLNLTEERPNFKKPFQVGSAGCTCAGK